MNFWKIDGLENIVVVIACDNIISIRYNSTVHKLVVIRISKDKIEVESWVNRDNKRGNKQKIQQPIAIFFTMKFVENLLIFLHDCSRHTNEKISLQ